MKWKWTIPFHIIAGFIIILSGVYISWWLAGLLFVAFLIIERWDKKETATSKYDFWEFGLAMFVMAGILLLAIGVITLIKFMGGLL